MRKVQNKIKLVTSIWLLFVVSFHSFVSDWSGKFEDYFFEKNTIESLEEHPIVESSIHYSQFSFQKKLLVFQATLVESFVELTWEYGSETKLSGYEVQRSRDGKKFVKIAWVGAFGKVEGASYLYVDDSNGDKNRFHYRLKLVYKDNSSEYSDIQLASLPKIVRGWN